MQASYPHLWTYVCPHGKIHCKHGEYIPRTHFILINKVHWTMDLWTFYLKLWQKVNSQLKLVTFIFVIMNNLYIKLILIISWYKTISYKQHKKLRLFMYMNKSIIFQSFVKLWTSCTNGSIYVLIPKVKNKKRETKSIFHIWLSLTQNKASLSIEEKVEVLKCIDFCFQH